MYGKAYAMWMQGAMEAWTLGMEAPMVVGLRMTKLAFERNPAAEIQLMLSEKVQAAFELQTGLMTGRFAATPAGAAKTIRHVRRKVSANRKRLSR